MIVIFRLLLETCFFVSSSGVIFNLPLNRVKCLREEVKKNDLLTGEYEVTPLGPGQAVEYVVTDSRMNILSKQELIRGAGKFSFIMENNDVFEVCFRSKSRSPHSNNHHEISLILKKSTEAKPYQLFAEANLLKPMELSLKMVESLASGIVQDLIFIKEREKEMRDTNESTSNRVFFLNIISILILMGLAFWQVLYLRNFFKSKKLLD